MFIYFKNNYLYQNNYLWLSNKSGSKEDKQKLASNMLGINAQVVKEVFNCDANSLPCVYLFTLGYVKDLRESMNINDNYDDNSIVAKYGFSKNLTRRTKEHISNYNKIPGCNLKLKQYSYIDPQYTLSGEADIKEFITNLDLKLSYKNEEELIVIPTKFIKLITDKYEHIGKKYSGHISELITKIKELSKKQSFLDNSSWQKAKLFCQQELENHIEKQTLTSDLTLQKEKYEHELLKKDYEILKLKSDNITYSI